MLCTRILNHTAFSKGHGYLLGLYFLFFFHYLYRMFYILIYKLVVLGYRNA